MLADALSQEAINAIVDPVILDNYDIYSEAGFRDDGTAYVAFTEPLPPEDREILLAHPSITLIENAALSADAADAASSELFSAALEVSSEDATVSVHVNPLDGSAEVAGSEPLSSSVRSLLRKDAGGRLAQTHKSATIAHSRVTFTVDSTLAADSEAINGGDTLTGIKSTALVCTAAFPAKSGTSTGLLTAGHCPERLSANGGDRLYASSKERDGKSGDTQWHKSKVAVNPQFRHAWSSFRPVWAHPVLKVGTKVCRFGGVSGNGSGCTTVKYVSACITYESGEYCNLAMTKTHTGSTFGDSGGPWYYGNNAYGIHSGSGSREGARRNWFYPSRVALSVSGLTAMIGPR